MNSSSSHRVRPAHAFRFSRRPLALAVALALPLAAGLAQAAATEDPRHDESARLEEVVVTASPLRDQAEGLTDPVEVLAGEELDKARSATLGETLSGLPGVQSSNFGPGVGRPIIRGLEGARVAVLSGGLGTQDVSTVSQDHALAVEPFLADQIEVLKGPATLLFGSGAIGGVVNVVDGRIPEAAPDEAWSGRVETRYDSASDGATDLLRLDGGNEGFAWHADAVYRDQRDYDTPDGEQPNSFIDTRTGALGGSLLGDWGFAGMAVSRFDNVYGNPGEPGDPSAGEGGVRLDVEQSRYEAKAGLNDPFAGVGQLRASFARTDYEHIEFEGDEVGTQFFKDATEGRLELQHDAFAGWSGALGVQATDSEFDAIGEEAFVPRTQTRGLGAFLTERRSWEVLQLDLGVRIDNVRSDPDGAQARDFSPFSASAGLRWEMDDRWEWTANLDHAERAPAEEELFANGPHVATAAFEIGDPDLTEEAANQLELGVHYHGDRFEAKLSAYHNRIDDFIFLRDTGEVVEGEEDALPVRRHTQRDARFRGLEGEATVHLADGADGAWELRVFGDTVRATFSDGGGNVPRIAPARFGSELRWEKDAWRASLGAVRHATQDEVAEKG